VRRVVGRAAEYAKAGFAAVEWPPVVAMLECVESPTSDLGSGLVQIRVQVLGRVGRPEVGLDLAG